MPTGLVRCATNPASWLRATGGAFEAGVIRDAREALESGRPALHTYSLAGTGAGGDGQDCGGTVKVFIDPVGAPDKLWIFGAGHVGAALAAASRGLGFEVTVFDDRPEFVESSRLPGARRAISTDPLYRDKIPPPDARTFCVVATRAHRTDRAALHAALSGSAAWVGMIGSARKRLAIFKESAARECRRRCRKGFPRSGSAGRSAAAPFPLRKQARPGRGAAGK